MDVLAPVKAFDRYQRRHAVLAVPIAVLRNFSDQGAGNAAAVLAYWSFFSIFPLLLLFATILGFVLHGNPSAQHAVVNSALKEFPIIGAQPDTLKGSGAGLVIGFVGTVWAGLGVTVAAQNAFNRVYAVPHRERPDFLISRWRGLKVLAVVGVLQVISTVVTGLVTSGLGGTGLLIAGIVLSLSLNLVLFSVVFRLLTDDAVPTREIWPGIVLAAVGWEILQAVGGIYVQHVIRGAGQTYGAFATVIGLLAWLYLGARIVIFAAEINVVLKRRLWPRSIFEPPEPADRKARAALAKVEERDDRETIEVAFHPPKPASARRVGRPPYAVAPAPAPGEHAEAAALGVAGPDLHTLTVADLVAALHRELDTVDAAPADRQRAHHWLDRASTVGEADPLAPAMRALSEAARRTLGLVEG